MKSGLPSNHISSVGTVAVTISGGVVERSGLSSSLAWSLASGGIAATTSGGGVAPSFHGPRGSEAPYQSWVFVR